MVSQSPRFFFNKIFKNNAADHIFFQELRMIAGTVHRGTVLASIKAAQYADEACELLQSNKDSSEHGFHTSI